jgi:death-on-curing protein
MIGRLDAEDLLLVLGESTGPQTRVRDPSILCSSAFRPNARIVGKPVFDDLPSHAAALLHSITRWEPLDMWNASFGWRAIRTLVKINGGELQMSAQDRMILTNEIVDGRIDDVAEIADRLVPFLHT